MLSKNRLYQSVIILLLTLSSSQTAIAQELLILTEALPPLQSIDNKGKVTGTMTQKVRRLLSNAGLKADIVMMPWARAYNTALTRPNTLIYSTARMPEREDQFIWLGQLGKSETHLMGLTSRHDLKIKSYNDLSKWLIGVKRHDVSAKFLRDKKVSVRNLMVQTNTIDIVRMLIKGRIDLIPTNEEQLMHYCEMLGCQVQQFDRVFTLAEMTQDLYLAANLDSDAGVLQRISKAFKTIEKN